MKKYYGSLTNDISEREKKNMQLARIAAREGFVLIKNDGALPLKNKKIALYGMGVRKTVKGGTGSGSVQERHSVSIDEGLRNAGYDITTKRYLDDYDAIYQTAYKEWHDKIDEKTADMPLMEALGMLGILGGFQWPAGRYITRQDIAESDTDTAIYVIARQAGEGNDRKLEKGDWYLSEVERANLELISTEYSNSIVIINVGGQIDLSLIEEIDGIKALVFYAQGGMEGGNALADVLSGKYSFCGKLADTWAMKYEDIPFAMDYSYLNKELENEDYREGIYVGYRYFDTFQIQPRYPFGFGLSYTNFSIASGDAKIDGTRVSVRVEVRNTGDTYAGKEIVQAYLSCPDASGKKEYQKLVAFAKTRELKPGDGQVLDLEFDMVDAASYSEKESAWYLDEGEYLLKIGSSSRATEPALLIELPSAIKTAQCRSCCSPENHLNEIGLPSKQQQFTFGVQRVILHPEVFTTFIHEYMEPVVQETSRETELLDSFTTEQMVSLVKGGNLQARHPEIHGALGTVGRTSLEIRVHGVGNIVFSDGPAGLNIVEHVLLDETGIEKPAAIPEKYSFGTFSKMAKQLIGVEGTHIYRHATAWPVELLLAQTWDVELIEQVGKGMGVELEEFGITLLLAPGMNIHRNPLCGRNFEYFSEDPLLTGKMAAALISGVQSYHGIGLTVKHFCCNNQEDNRTGVSSNVNERTLREIYLRPFEIAIRDAHPLALMSSYNRLNGIYTANNHELLTDILRCEWGFSGVVMTDWNSCAPKCAVPAKCVPAGNDLIMPGNDKDTEAILKAVNDGEISMEELRRCACRVLKLVLNSSICSAEEERL